MTSSCHPGDATVPALTGQSIARLTERPSAEVLIIGGGINGISTFRDLALQGVDVALVERADFCSGASAASSHMIHGGIRYLENGEFRLVRESVMERNALISLAPHYVKPLRTTVPIFTTFSGLLNAPMRFLTHRQGKPSERGAVLIKAGLVLYDFFSRGGRAVPRHRFQGRKASLAELPRLNPSIKYTATYYDASMHDPERLALDVLRDGLEAGGERARAVNYVEAVGAEDGGVLLRDHRTGEEFAFTADLVVNASGPWTDLTNRALGEDTSYMGGTKGSHIVLDNPELLEATGGRELFFEHSDGRIVLIYPLKGRVMVGTTDIDADPAKPALCTEEEVDYFFDLIAHVFPEIPVDRSQIVYRFSGIRPLPGHGDTQPGFVSRDYRIVPSAVDGVKTLSLVGGKWTTFRALGEQLSDEVLARLRRPRRQRTAERPIGGGDGYPRSERERENWLAEHPGVERARALALLERYGTYAARLIEAIAREGEEPLTSAPDYTDTELRYLARHESVVQLADLVQRRTSLAFTGRADAAVLAEVVDVVAPVLGWDAERRDEEVHRLAVLLAQRHGVASALGSGTAAGPAPGTGEAQSQENQEDRAHRVS
ncbi:glycerol-3-phosphate dehydrogenase/oxidase [Sediminivirga luteola]|uniref:glycerol-3-phosphate dehydrogenase/oxidase n=1 Tax=Sediminivirga luteola TaxID=1774748 RepID=UPI003BB60CF6